MKCLIPNSLFWIAALLMITAVACNKNPENLPGYNPATSAFVNAFTTGEISKGSAIRVHFTEQLADSAMIGQDADKSLFAFCPTIVSKSLFTLL